MKNDVSKLKSEYQKINKNKQINHIVLKVDYDDLCMNFFGDKYNTLVTQKLAQESSIIALESENLYVNWLNKE